MKNQRIKVNVTLTKSQNDKLKQIQKAIGATSRQEAIRHLITVDEKVR